MVTFGMMAVCLFSRVNCICEVSFFLFECFLFRLCVHRNTRTLSPFGR